MHMRIRYYFLVDLHVTRHARETESEKRIRNTQNIPVIIGPKPHESTHFLYTIKNSPMDLSRKSRTSTNTSEFNHQQR